MRRQESNTLAFFCPMFPGSPMQKVCVSIISSLLSVYVEQNKICTFSLPRQIDLRLVYSYILLKYDILKQAQVKKKRKFTVFSSLFYQDYALDCVYVQGHTHKYCVCVFRHQSVNSSKYVQRQAVFNRTFKLPLMTTCKKKHKCMLFHSVLPLYQTVRFEQRILLVASFIKSFHILKHKLIHLNSRLYNRRLITSA